MAQKEGEIENLSGQLQEVGESARQADWELSQALNRVKQHELDRPSIESYHEETQHQYA